MKIAKGFGVMLVSSLSWLTAFTTLAAEEYEYPELQVTPRASERLSEEAKKEDSQAWTVHAHVQASALVTLTAGLMAMNDQAVLDDGYENYPEGSDERSAEKSDAEDKKDKKDAIARSSGQVGVLVGASWLAATVTMSALYRPYQSCQKGLGRDKVKSKRDALAKERAAEECLESPARLAKRLNLLSATSNFIAGVLIAATSNEQLHQVMGGLAALTAFSPYVFDYYWEDINSYHQDYKKRIYGPVASAAPTMIFNESNNKLAPALALNIRW